MAILVMGGTGQIGSRVVAELTKRGAEVRALATKKPNEELPEGVDLILGDVMDVDFMRALLKTVSTVFILNPGVPDELARLLLVFSLIEEAGIERAVFVSMMGVDRFVESSRAASKLVAEELIHRRNIPTTILRPNAVFQNDAAQLAMIKDSGVYATPVGGIGMTMIDIRDVAEVAAVELLRRETAGAPLPTQVFELVGPETLTGESIATIWSEVLGRPVLYRGDDLPFVQEGFRRVMPSSSAYDLGLVFQGILREGVIGGPSAADRVAELLGHSLRSYRAFAEELAPAKPEGRSV